VPKALVCINTDFFAAEEVLEELKACYEVEEVFRVHGVYDVVAKIRGDTTESLLETITRYIKRLRGVHTAHTMLIIESEKPAYENEDVMMI
jgi:DNA-binding Lrp family transcriptional regulator